MGDKLRRQMAGRLSVQQRTLLHKSWQLRYCVFLAEETGGSPQIHVYDKEEHYKKHSKDLKIFSLDRVKKIQYGKDRPHEFTIITEKEKFRFAAEDDRDFKLWIHTLKQDLNVNTIHDPDGIVEEEESDSHLYMDDNIIYESAEITPMFSVVIEDNETSKRCNLTGRYLLVVNPHNLALVDCSTKKAIYQWPFKYIRRFGKTRSNFQFEAGRKCPSGEGEFSFHTNQGFEIFDAFSKTTQRIRDRDEDDPLRQSGPKHSKTPSQVSPTPARVSPTPLLRPASEASEPVPSINTDRRTIKSGGQIGGGQIGHVPQKFASELSNVLLHHKEVDHLQAGKHAAHTTEDVKTSKKDKQKSDKKHAPQASVEHSTEDVQTSKKDKQKSDKKGSEKSEKKLKKEHKEKEKKEDKTKKKEKVRPTVSVPKSPIGAYVHAYEDVDDIAPRVSNTEPEPLYAEAVSPTSDRPASIPKPRPDSKKPSPETDLYSEPQKMKDHSWKKHAMKEDNEHQEDYDKIKAAAMSSGVTMSAVTNGRLKQEEGGHHLPVHPKSVIEDDDGTYDHIGNLSIKSAPAQPESLYGTVSGKDISSIKKGKDDVVGSKKKAAKQDGNAYEEPKFCSEEDDYVDIQ